MNGGQIDLEKKRRNSEKRCVVQVDRGKEGEDMVFPVSQGHCRRLELKKKRPIGR